MQALSRFFKFDAYDTNLQNELLAGLTTYLTMAYIIFVNPNVLQLAGMDKGAVFTATCLITAFASLVIGLSANAPVAIAPGMALNTFFAYVVVNTHGYHWESALGMVFISGILFVILTLTRVRHLILTSIPDGINSAIIVGISFLIALIALKNNHIIIVSTKGQLQLGEMLSYPSLMFWLGFLLIIALDYYKVRGSVLISIVSITVVSLIKSHHGISFSSLFSTPPSLKATFFQLNFNDLHSAHALKHVFAFFLIALFDATGTFIGLLKQPLFQNKVDINRTIEKSLLVDSVATTIGALLGTSSTSPFIESAAGIEAGGRTGLVTVTVAVLFFLSLFIFPMASLIPSFAVGAALLYIACCMLREITKIQIKPSTDFIAAVVTLVMIPFSFSIADGIGLGLICYCLLNLVTKQTHKLNPMLIILSVVFLIYFL